LLTTIKKVSYDDAVVLKTFFRKPANLFFVYLWTRIVLIRFHRYVPLRKSKFYSICVMYCINCILLSYTINVQL